VPDCYTDLYLVVEKFRERLAVGKRTTQKFDMERFNHKKLDEIEGKEQYRVEMSIKIAAMENLDDDMVINRDWETIKENIKISAKESIGYCELKKRKPWFDEGC
jgi:hypothetical protein